MRIKYRVDLTEEEREHLLGDEGVAAVLNVGYATVGRVRHRFVEEGLERAL